MAKRLIAREVSAALLEMRGNISAAAKRLGYSRSAVHRYIQAHPSIQQVLDEARDSADDNVRSVLYAKAMEGEGWAVRFHLQTRGGTQAYVERHELSGVDGAPITINLSWDNGGGDAADGD